DGDEGGLHAGQYAGDAPLVDVTDVAASGLALDEDLGDGAVLEEGHPRLAGGGADDEVLGHGRSLPGAAPPVRSGAADARAGVRSRGSGARGEGSIEIGGERRGNADGQFAKRRIRTLRMRPTARNE